MTVAVEGTGCQPGTRQEYHKHLINSQATACSMRDTSKGGTKKTQPLPAVGRGWPWGQTVTVGSDMGRRAQRSAEKVSPGVLVATGLEGGT